MNIKDQNINYLNKSFSDFRASLMNFAQSYFPNIYTDFSDSDPETLFLEMSSYIGDVLSFYLDTQIQENLFLRAKEEANVIQSAYVLGYRPQMSYASVADIDIYQIVAATSSMGNIVPNYSYGVTVGEYTTLSGANGVNFLTVEEARFDQASNPTVLFRDTGSFFLKQTVSAISATVKTTTLNFNTTQPKFVTSAIGDTNILKIINAIDTNTSGSWYEVPYLAQDSIVIQNINPNYANDGIKYLLQYKQVPQRFTTRFIDETTLEFEFGAGTTSFDDSTIIPDMDNLGLGNIAIPASYFDPNGYNKAKTLFTREYGLTPSNTNIVVSYLVGGGILSNISANQITSIDTSNIGFNQNDIYQSLTVTNPSGSSGGRSGDTIDEIKLNSLYAFQAQNRAVTKSDYVLRALSMPNDFGVVSKAQVIQDSIITSTSSNDGFIANNPLAVNLYVLSYDINGNLTTASDTLKTNLANYIEEYRMATDAINIKDAYVINIGINFDITTNPGFNNNDVITNCIIALQDMFSIDQWQINQPIIISDIFTTLFDVKGVQSIPSISIINLQGNNYSQYGYDIIGATRNNIVYPSIDPCIFEVKYPSNDISGRSIVP